MTLLELTIVISVLLLLLSVLFIGAQSWKKGSDRAGCILNIRKVQVATRSYQNVHNLNDGTTINMFLTVLGPQGFAQNPTCPANGDYDHIDHIPYPGELAIWCSLASSDDHEPDDFTDW